MKTVAVLFARKDSIYKSMPGCDVWDIDRDARLWPGGAPIVGHPPCRAFGQLKHMAKPRPDEKELAYFCVRQIQKWGGVLEHPKASSLWPEMGLPSIGRFDTLGGFTLAFPQFWFGHLAEKATKFYIVGCKPADFPEIPFKMAEAERTMSGMTKEDLKKVGAKPELLKKDREKTPPALAEWLVELARRCKI